MVSTTAPDPSRTLIVLLFSLLTKTSPVFLAPAGDRRPPRRRTMAPVAAQAGLRFTPSLPLARENFLMAGGPTQAGDGVNCRGKERHSMSKARPVERAARETGRCREYAGFRHGPAL